MLFRVCMVLLLLPSARSFFSPHLRSSSVHFARKSVDPSFFSEDFSTSSKKSRRKSLSPSYRPRTDNQVNYVEALKNKESPIVLGLGPAGCGKTLFACITAMHELNAGNINKIILTRPVVPVEEEELGFLPGNLIRKMDPWTRPIFDIFLEFYQQREIEAMLHSGVIEISPLAYMRGRTFKRSFLIADEMQNSTPNQMMMLTTRIGDHSKMVITGDLKQSDKLENNGLLDFTKKFDMYKTWGGMEAVESGIQLVKMNETDIQRSPIVNEILRIYNIPKINYAYHPMHSDLLQLKEETVEPKVEEKKISKKAEPTSDCAMIPKDQEPKRRY